MPAGEFEIHPEALLEADADLGWYLERSRAAAERFFSEVERAIELILESPDRWPSYLYGTRRYVLYGFPYLIQEGRLAVPPEMRAVLEPRQPSGRGPRISSRPANPEPRCGRRAGGRRTCDPLR
jgi:hypothetical protein